MLYNYPFSVYAPFNRSATGSLTGSQVLGVTANAPGFVVYSTVDMYVETHIEGQGITNPNVGSFKIPAGQYWMVPINKTKEVRLCPVTATGHYSLSFLNGPQTSESFSSSFYNRGPGAVFEGGGGGD